MKLYAESVLIGSQWQTDKTILINVDGTIEAITQGKAKDALNVGGAIVPGMVNCHSHAFQRALAGLSEYRATPSDSFWSWRDIMYRFVAKMSPHDVFVVARYVYMEMLKAGYTSVAEFHYLHHQANGCCYDDPAEMSYQVIHAARQAGIAITHLPVLYTYAGFDQQKPSLSQARFIYQTEGYCRLLESLTRFICCQDTRFQDMVKLGIAPHSLRAVSQAQLAAVVPFIKAVDGNSPVHIHIAEQRQEVDDCQDFYGKRPVEWLLDNQTMDKTWCLIHATHLVAAEATRLATSGAIAGVCPTTEANLGDGIFPAAEYLRMQGRLAIGSDSHIAVNVADELRMLEYGQRLTNHQRAMLVEENCLSVGQNLYIKAAQNGAFAINQNVGEINPGKRADFVVLNTSHPMLAGKKGHYLIDSAIFACSQLPVKAVMVAGQWQIEDGAHPMQRKIKDDYLRVIERLIE